MAGAFGAFEQIPIKPARAATPARRCGDHDPVDIDKARIAFAEPEEIRAVIVGVLIEGEQEGIEIADASRQERLGDKMLQPLRLQPG